MIETWVLREENSSTPRLSVRIGKARAREVLVEAVDDQLLRRNFEHARKEAPASCWVPLMSHDDGQSGRARRSDLLR